MPETLKGSGSPAFIGPKSWPPLELKEKPTARCPIATLLGASKANLLTQYCVPCGSENFFVRVSLSSPVQYEPVSFPVLFKNVHTPPSFEGQMSAIGPVVGRPVTDA